MGHTLHHEVWEPQLFTSLCVGADTKLFSDTLVSDFCKRVAINSGACLT